MAREIVIDAKFANRVGRRISKANARILDRHHRMRFELYLGSILRYKVIVLPPERFMGNRKPVMAQLVGEGDLERVARAFCLKYDIPPQNIQVLSGSNMPYDEDVRVPVKEGEQGKEAGEGSEEAEPEDSEDAKQVADTGDGSQADSRLQTKPEPATPLVEVKSEPKPAKAKPAGVVPQAIPIVPRKRS